MKLFRFALILALLMLSGFFAFEGLNLSKRTVLHQLASTKAENFDPKSEKVQKLVNSHLSVTSQKLQIEEDRIKFENNKAPEVGDRLWPSAATKIDGTPQGIDFSGDTNESSAYEDLDRHPKEYSLVQSAHHKIQNENALIEENNRREQQSRELFAQQFVENARKKGYAVQLDENLVVISVKKISGGQSY